MGRPETPAGQHGAPRITRTATGYRARVRLRLYDYKSRNADDGSFRPGLPVDVVCRVPSSDPKDRGTLDAIAKACEARIARARQDANGVPAIEVRVRPSTWTVGDFATRAVDRLVAQGDVRPTTAEVYRRYITTHLDGSALGRMRAFDADSTHITTHIKVIAKGSGPAVARHARVVLHHAFDYAQDPEGWGWTGEKFAKLPSNPARLAPRLRTRDAKAKVSKLDHTRALDVRRDPATREIVRDERVTLAWAVARDQRTTGLDLRDFILAGLALGCRIGELSAVRWCDLNLSEGTPSVAITGTITRIKDQGLTRSDTKTETSVRVIPIPRRIAALLRRRARAAGVDLVAIADDERPVFPSPRHLAKDKFRDQSVLQNRLREAFDRAGFPWLSFHGLRRTAITTMVAAGVPIATASHYAGHSAIRTTLDTYVGRTAEIDPGIVEHL